MYIQYNSMTLLLSIEGNIGSGKSTLVAKLREKYGNNKEICFLDEPVNEWETIKDNEGKSMLEKYYGNQSKYAFAFQMMAYISRLAPLRKALKKNYKIIITERSVYTDKMVFAKMLYNDNKMESVEHQIYNKWFHEFINDIPTPHIVYVKTDPEIAKKRVDKRARTGETIPLEYLKNCHDYHENWLIKNSHRNMFLWCCDEVETLMKEANPEILNKYLLTLDGNIDIIKSPIQPSLWIQEIKQFVGIDY